MTKLQTNVIEIRFEFVILLHIRLYANKHPRVNLIHSRYSLFAYGADSGGVLTFKS